MPMFLVNFMMSIFSIASPADNRNLAELRASSVSRRSGNWNTQLHEQEIAIAQEMTGLLGSRYFHANENSIGSARCFAFNHSH